jgi:serine/threonine-protein kinase
MVGRPAPEAFADLARAGLTAGRVRERVVAGTPAGVVVSTDPPAGTARPPKFPVAVVVSAPAATVDVPDFVGLSRAGAVTVARAGSVRGVGRDETVPAGSPEGGSVLSQSLPPGSPVAPGTLVELVVGVDPTAPPG